MATDVQDGAEHGPKHTRDLARALDTKVKNVPEQGHRMHGTELDGGDGVGRKLHKSPSNEIAKKKVPGMA